MSKKTDGRTNRVSREQQLAIRLDRDFVNELHSISTQMRQDTSALARMVLHEFVACFITRAQAKNLGLEREWLSQGLLRLALSQGSKHEQD